MEIIIGRDSRSASLSIVVDGHAQQTVSSASLPASIRPQHCRMTVLDGQILLKNTNINNYTYVNGQSIESKIVSQNDKIELGKERYLLAWKDLGPYLPTDISHLRQVWEYYESKNIELQIKERKFTTLRSATGIITMFAIALSIAAGGKSRWFVAVYGLAIIISLVFFVKAYLDSSKIPQRRLDLSRQFQRDYVCPRCKRFLGNQPYDLLAQNDCCPHCKTQFIH